MTWLGVIGPIALGVALIVGLALVTRRLARWAARRADIKARLAALKEPPRPPAKVVRIDRRRRPT